jgi:N-acetyl sugar amidotransferase
MDTTAPDITFDENGVCNYCTDFLRRIEASKARMGDMGASRDEFINAVKAAGTGHEYDCVVGVSGGVDSSYALYLAVQYGLRPLAVHLDNGWNSELASHNITRLVESLGVELYTHVIDWEENRDLQLSFFKANVLDIELLMDNAMLKLNYSQASRFGLKHILAGTNLMTEGMRFPAGWTHFKFDARNIRRIHRQFGSVPIRTHPLISTSQYVWYEYARGIKWVSFLDYVEYNKADALGLLQSEVGYRPYPYKHYESVFTRFYQAVILPEKFGYDKRRVHLGTLVASGQMSRDEALRLLAEPTYPDAAQREQDRVFVMKKLGFSEESFAQYMATPEVPHEHYGSERWLWDILAGTYKKLRPGVYI